MTEHELKAIICAEIKKVAPECDPESLDPKENFREAFDIDSYSFLQILVGLNDKTGVEIPESDYTKLYTLAGMVAYLSARTT